MNIQITELVIPILFCILTLFCLTGIMLSMRLRRMPDGVFVSLATMFICMWVSVFLSVYRYTFFPIGYDKEKFIRAGGMLFWGVTVFLLIVNLMCFMKEKHLIKQIAQKWKLREKIFVVLVILALCVPFYRYIEPRSFDYLHTAYLAGQSESRINLVVEEAEELDAFLPDSLSDDTFIAAQQLFQHISRWQGRKSPIDLQPGEHKFLFQVEIFHDDGHGCRVRLFTGRNKQYYLYVEENDHLQEGVTTWPFPMENGIYYRLLM